MSGIRTVIYLMCFFLIGCYSNEDTESSFLSESPTVNTVDWNPTLLQDPLEYFGIQNPALLVFRDDSLLCGVSQDVKSRCWPANWLDTNFEWYLKRMENELILFDSLRIVVMNNSFQILYDGPMPYDSIFNFNKLGMNIRPHGVLVVDSNAFFLSTAAGIYSIHRNLVSSLKYRITNASRFVISEADTCLLGNTDTLLCKQNSLWVSSDFPGVFNVRQFDPYFWNDKYWWIRTDDLSSNRFGFSTNLWSSDGLNSANTNKQIQNIGWLDGAKISTMTATSQYLMIWGIETYSENANYLTMTRVNSSNENDSLFLFGPLTPEVDELWSWKVDDNRIALALISNSLWNVNSKMKIYVLDRNGNRAGL